MGGGGGGGPGGSSASAMNKRTSSSSKWKTLFGDRGGTSADRDEIDDGMWDKVSGSVLFSFSAEIFSH
jgi:hypothetical protein